MNVDWHAKHTGQREQNPESHFGFSYKEARLNGRAGGGLMPTRWWLFGSLMFFVIGAAAAENLAAMYVALGVHFLAFLLHAIEVKLNKLLDHHGIRVTDAEIGRD